ncbi:MAG: hypothetical protein J1G02_01150 [Clostridiales bacterium]|nr:hypothetical protein [Clostridiales bacterium]
MDFDGVNSIVCDAEENDWLDVSYSERNYVAEPERKKSRLKIPKINIKLSKPVKIAIVAVLCVAILAALLFIDGNFASDVFQTAKAAVVSSVFDKPEQDVTAQTVAIPANANLVDVVDGVATFDGGRATLSFTAGKVTQVTDTSVIVAIDDTTCITYDNLTGVYVSVGDTVSVNSLIGKYDGTFTATLSVAGETVKDVIGSESQLTWYV